ncbi:MAG: response regulator transcription factor [Firmicutes bacterium]|nr:response regulator transcription factor [Bacillota bacterium]
MRVIIADDNTTELNLLRQFLYKEQDVNVISEETNGDDALKNIDKFKPDVAFLDISMPGLSGIKIAKRISTDIFVVFITAHQDYALDAFELGSVDYILKPVTYGRIEKSLSRIRRYMSNKQNIQKLSINIKGQLIAIDINKIVFIEKMPLQKKLKIYTKDKEYVVSGNLKNFEEQLKDYSFIRSHKSYLININMVNKLIPWGDKSYLAKMMGSKQEVLVSRKHAPIIKSLFNSI